MNFAHCLFWCLLWSGLLCGPALAEITLLGEAHLAGDSVDKSGLTVELDNGIPLNRLGGISAIEHVAGDEYILLSDRGPNDGAVPYLTRFHLAELFEDAPERFLRYAFSGIVDREHQGLLGFVYGHFHLLHDRGHQNCQNFPGITQWPLVKSPHQSRRHKLPGL